MSYPEVVVLLVLAGSLALFVTELVPLGVTGLGIIAVLGLSGDEVIHCLLDIMYARQSYKSISRAVHIHPTVAELIPTVLQEMVPLE